MKASLLALIIALVSTFDAIADEIKVTPILVDYLSFSEIEGAVFALGSDGCALLSRDGCKTWDRIRPFDQGDVLLIEKLDDKLIAVNSTGEFAISENAGGDWQKVANLDMEFLAAAKFPEGYFIRTKNSLLIVSNDFEVTSERPFFTNTEIYDAVGQYLKLNKSIAYHKGSFIVESDTTTLISFDKSLHPIDSISFKKLKIYKDTVWYERGYELIAEGDNLYFTASVIVKREGKYYSRKFIYIIKEFPGFEKFTELPKNTLHNIIHDKLISIERTNPLFNDSSIITKPYINYSYMDVFKFQNELLICGRTSILKQLSLPDSLLTTISDGSVAGGITFPEAINDTTLLLYSGSNFSFNLPILLSHNNGATVLPVSVKELINSDNKDFEYMFIFKYFDATNKVLHLIGRSQSNIQAKHFISYDIGKSFIIKDIEGLSFNSSIDYVANSNLPGCIQKHGDGFAGVIGQNFSLDDRKKIYLFDRDFNLTKRISLVTGILDYVVPFDTSSYFIHCANASGGNSEVRFTSNNGVNWETIKRYPKSNQELTVFDFKLNEEQYIGLSHFRPLDSTVVFDVVNLRTKELETVASWKVVIDSLTVVSSVAMDYDKDFLYITYCDTLFALRDLRDRGKWRHRIIPHNGRVYGKLKKVVDRFLALYYDEHTPYKGYYYWLEPEIPLSASENYQSEVRKNFLYCFPPYPNPARNEVRSLIYWDTSLDIDKDDISIYNLFGKVAGREDITIEKTAPYSGYLVWDCSRYEPGVYFIVVRHGDATQMIKAIVER